MKSLFLKIFLSFWAAQALFLVLAILVTIALSPARHGIEGEGPQILAEIVNAYMSGGEPAATAAGSTAFCPIVSSGRR